MITSRGSVRAVLAAAWVGFFVVSPGCGEPGEFDVEEAEHEEPGMERLDLGGLEGVALGDGESARTFDLERIDVAAPFDRVAFTWEAAGDAALEVSTDDGAWIPVEVSHRELVPETGITLYAGHADVAPGASSLSPRITLARAGVAAPAVLAVELQVFVAGEIVEAGDPPSSDSGSALEADLVAGLASVAPQPNIIGRDDWGAKPARCDGAKHTPRRMTWHHTATANGETGAAAKARMRQIQASHQLDLGYCDIGFHFVVDANGKVYRGRRTTRRTGNHVPGHNGGNLGLAMMGKFGAVAPPADEVKGLMNIAAFLADYWDISPTKDRILAHKSWQNAGTTCPGAKAFAKREGILDGIQNRLKPSGPRVGDFVSTSCTTTSVRKLSEQLIAELNCMVPGAVKKIPADNQINTGSAFPYLQSRPANRLPTIANDRPGATMTIHSALRSLAQQYLLYTWWDTNRCGIALAAKPGTSNHERGLAVDISDNAGWRSEFESHGFDWLGPSDPVHFDYEGGGTVNIGGRSVLAFQRLWNANNPDDRIATDGQYGPGIALRLRRSPANGFAIYSTCGNHAGTVATAAAAPFVLEENPETCGL